MKKINDYYKNAYLTVGVTRDNFLIENCSDDFIELAKKSLSINQNDFKSLVVTIDKNLQLNLEKSLNLYEDSIHKEIISRDFVSSLIIREILKYTKDDNELESIENGIRNVLSGNPDRLREFISHAPMPYIVDWKLRKLGKCELNMFIQDIDNIFLQRAINSYLASRTKYSIKLFNNNSSLCTYYAEGGVLIQSPHDYMVRDAREMVENFEFEL